MDTTRPSPATAYWAAARRPLFLGKRGERERAAAPLRGSREVRFQSRLFGRRGSSSENTREEAGRPDAVRARASSRAGGARARREEAEHFRRLPLNRS